MNAQTKIDPLDLLRKPFPPNHISKLPKETKKQIEERRNGQNVIRDCPECGGYHHKHALHLDYVGHAALTDRLLDADPFWTWEPLAFNAEGLPAFDRNGGLWIKLTVASVTRLGYGSADGKSGGDAVKEIIGDALRNAAMRFGAALDLWHKGDLHMEDGDSSEGGTSEDNSGDGKVSRDGPANSNLRDQLEQSVAQIDRKPAKGWREPDSPYSTPSKLHTACTYFERELMGCGDSDMVYAVTARDDWKEFVRVCELHAEHYLRGGPPAPPEFEGLINTAARLVKEFDEAEASHMTDLARA